VLRARREGRGTGENGRRTIQTLELLPLAGMVSVSTVTVKASGGEVPPYRLSIPNREVREVYPSTFQVWPRAKLSKTP
jgi:hypothetical protein